MKILNIRDVLLMFEFKKRKVKSAVMQRKISKKYYLDSTVLDIGISLIPVLVFVLSLIKSL